MVILLLIVDPCEILGKLSSPLVILILGLNLTLSLKGINGDNNEGRLSRVVIFKIILVKNFILPVVGFLLVYYLGYRLGLIDDKLVCFFLLLNFYTPTAINMITMAIINKFQVILFYKILIWN